MKNKELEEKIVSAKTQLSILLAEQKRRKSVQAKYDKLYYKFKDIKKQLREISESLECGEFRKQWHTILKSMNLSERKLQQMDSEIMSTWSKESSWIEDRNKKYSSAVFYSNVDPEFDRDFAMAYDLI